VEQILISACLLGERVRYHGGDARIEHRILERWQSEGRLVPLCPEVAGGLTTPRPAAEIRTIAAGRRVLTAAGDDVTAAFERGAEMAAATCAARGIRIAVLKDGSPSCGSTSVYDGRFRGVRVSGLGITAERLAAAGVAVFREDQLEAANEYVGTLERSTQPSGDKEDTKGDAF
jgi:uncharacterized protein YbbK (DUF523 family)